MIFYAMSLTVLNTGWSMIWLQPSWQGLLLHQFKKDYSLTKVIIRQNLLEKWKKDFHKKFREKKKQWTNDKSSPKIKNLEYWPLLTPHTCMWLWYGKSHRLTDSFDSLLLFLSLKSHSKNASRIFHNLHYKEKDYIVSK